MKISSAATALPEHYYSQHTLLDKFRKHWGPRLERFSVLEKLHAAAQVDGRYLALPIDSYPLKSWGEANNAWIETTLKLGKKLLATRCARRTSNRKTLARYFSFR